MRISAPDWLHRLCHRDAIIPLTHYLERSPWGLRREPAEAAFLDKAGVYCFWWAGPPEVLRQRLAEYRYTGETHTRRPADEFDHGLVPTYVGMTGRALYRKGRGHDGRMHQRLVQFPNSMRLWLTSPGEARLLEPTTGFCGNYNLFGFRDRVVAFMSADGRPGLTPAAAQELLCARPADWQHAIAAFHDEYLNLLYDNYCLSFVPFDDLADCFYAEALAVGLLRPCLNLS